MKASAIVLGQAIPNGPLMGVPVHMTPDQGIKRVIAVTAGEYEYCTLRIAELGDDPYEPRPGYTKGEKVTRVRGNKGAMVGLVNYTEKEIEESERARELNLWIKERQKVGDRLARYCKMAHEMGVAEREIALAESQAALIAGLMVRVMDALKLSEKQRITARGIVHRELLVLEQPNGEG
jgi:hypothetical protein